MKKILTISVLTLLPFFSFGIPHAGAMLITEYTKMNTQGQADFSTYMVNKIIDLKIEEGKEEEVRKLKIFFLEPLDDLEGGQWQRGSFYLYNVYNVFTGLWATDYLKNEPHVELGISIMLEELKIPVPLETLRTFGDAYKIPPNAYRK